MDMLVAQHVVSSGGLPICPAGRIVTGLQGNPGWKVNIRHRSQPYNGGNVKRNGVFPIIGWFTVFSHILKWHMAPKSRSILHSEARYGRPADRRTRFDPV